MAGARSWLRRASSGRRASARPFPAGRPPPTYQVARPAIPCWSRVRTPPIRPGRERTLQRNVELVQAQDGAVELGKHHRVELQPLGLVYRHDPHGRGRGLLDGRDRHEFHELPRPQRDRHQDRTSRPIPPVAPSPWPAPARRRRAASSCRGPMGDYARHTPSSANANRAFNAARCTSRGVEIGHAQDRRSRVEWNTSKAL